MKQCIQCETLLDNNAQYCSACGADQRFSAFSVGDRFSNGSLKKQGAAKTSYFLVALCVFTILVSVNGIVQLVIGREYYTGGTFSLLLSAAVSLSKLAGATLMLIKRIWGLYVYTAAVGISLFFSVSQVFGFGALDFAMKIGVVISIAVQIALLVMFWLDVNRKTLS